MGYAVGTVATLSVGAYNFYKPYGVIDDILDKRIRADDGDVNTTKYVVPFYTSQTLAHTTIYGTQNNRPVPFDNITVFGEGMSKGSLGFNASWTTYEYEGQVQLLESL